MSKHGKVFLKYAPQIILILASVLVLGLSAKTYTWIKQNGDFATTSFVLEAKAECYEHTDEKIKDYKNDNREELKNIYTQLNNLNDKMDRVLMK